MKRFPSTIAAGLLACLALSAHAVTFRPTGDTYSTLDFSAGKNPIVTKRFLTNAAGEAGSLEISKAHSAFLQFNAAAQLLALATAEETGGFVTVTSARLTIYCGSVTTAGQLDLCSVTGAWSETFKGTSAAEPAYNSTPIATAATPSAKQFVTFDVTTAVQDAMVAGASEDDGFAIVSHGGVASVVIGAKEGPGTGYPAVLEVDVDNPFDGPLVATTGGFTSNVGIGTAGPNTGFPLTIQGQYVPESGASTEIFLEDSTGTPRWHIQLEVVDPGPNQVFNFGFSETNVADDRFVLAAGGNVGIGMAAPAYPLDINGGASGVRIASSAATTQNAGNPGASLILENSSGSPSQDWLLGANSNNIGAFAPSGAFVIADHTSNLTRLFITSGAGTGNVQIGGPIAFGGTPANLSVTGALTVSNESTLTGNVGIGMAASTYPLDVANSIFPSGLTGSSLFGLGPVEQTIQAPSAPSTIHAEGGVVAELFVATSDARIKDIEGRSDSAADLRKLLGIEITDFHYKDKIGKGGGPQKKVIAQQVEKIFPQAVSQHPDVVPDLYRKATIHDGWVELATDLKAGERVKLIGESEHGIYEVLEVKEGAFRTAFKPSTERVFVYGREVKDFRTVDYEAIAMLNVSATQELAKKLEAREAELAALCAANAAQAQKLAALETKDRDRDAKDREREVRLTRLENALEGQSDRSVTTASLRLK